MDEERLREAVQNDDVRAIREIVLSGDPAHAGVSAILGSYLIFACSAGFTKTAAELIRLGADTSCSNEQGETALSFSVVYDEIECAKILLESGVSPNMPDKDELGWTPIMYAVYHGHERMADLLLSHGADVNQRDNVAWSCLMRAVNPKCSCSLFAKIIKRTNDISYRNEGGDSALSLARELKLTPLEEALKALGAS